MPDQDDSPPELTGLVIGDELLSGKVNEDNMSFLIQECRTLGVRLTSVHLLPDDVPYLAEQIREASRRTDYVVTSGGLGPTHDDRTMNAVSKAFDAPITRNETYEETLKNVYDEEADETVLSMADMPEGIEFVWGDMLDIPAARYENVFILPGDPRLFRSKFSAIRDLIRSPHEFYHHNIFLDMKETDLSHMLDHLQDSHSSVTVGSYPSPWNEQYREMITIESTEEEAVETAARELLDRLPSDRIVRIERG